jgi:hypothetical protein
MKRLVLAATIFSIPAIAMAQQAPPNPSPDEKSWQAMFNREVQVHQADLTAAYRLQEANAELGKEVTDLKKKVADAEMAKAKDEKPGAGPVVGNHP